MPIFKIPRRFVCTAVWLLVVGAMLVCARGADIWIEGENAMRTNMKPHPWYAGGVVKADLSGGDFISNFGPEVGTADYQFDVAEAGSYTFWIRANPVGDPKMDYQLNGGAWTAVSFAHPVDVTNIAADAKPDLRFIAWIRVGQVNLPAGRNEISFRLHSANSNHGSIDCFVFANGAFTPNGKLKPGERVGSDEAGWWAFEPGPERFGKDALLDLRGLNEAEAGQSGFVDASGDQFKLGDGRPVRFWAVNTSAPGAEVSHEEMDFMAARFAKLGINMVRIHGGLFDRSGSDPTKINPARLDNYFYLINALKKQGIYVTLSEYFPLWMNVKASDGIPGTEDIYGKIPFGLLIFEPRMQQIYKSWIKQVLTTRSPYSGKTLAEEPSVGLFEIQNEDSLFFWTFQPKALGSGPRELLEKHYGKWLAAKYGSVQAALAAWPGDKNPDDDPAAGKAGLYGAYEMSSMGVKQSSPDRKKRIVDQVHFLAGLQHDFYVGMKDYLRNDLGAKWPISASNWTTAPGLGFVERYTYSGVNVIDKHGYFGGKHTGEGAGWSVRKGQSYEDKTSMYDPTSAPFQYVRLPGHPHIQTEIAWNKPNRFIAEGEPLVSAYESLQGVDGVYFFAAGSGDWDKSGTGNWTYMMPGEIGQSPAEALQYRRGDLLPGKTVLRQVTTVEDVLGLKSSNIIEGANADFRMDAAPKTAAGDLNAGFDPLAFFVGRVERTMEPGAVPVALDLSKFVDRAQKRVVSSTYQEVWYYGHGVMLVNSPNSQAAVGFLGGAGALQLTDVVIRCRNEYAAVHVISLDGIPLAMSRKILVQAFTEEKMTGFKQAGGVIQDVGRAPVLVRDIDATVTLDNGTRVKAVSLDEQGYRRGDLPVRVEAGKAVIALPRDALYTILTR